MGTDRRLKGRNGALPAHAAGMMVLLLLAAGPPAARAQVQVEDGCMEDLYNRFGQGGGLNCTANDIQIASVTNVVIKDDGCAFAGDTVTFDATLEVLLTAQDRHDIGIYIAQDGGDALNGECVVTNLPYAPSNENCTASTTPYPCCNGSGTGTCEFVDLDKTGDTGKGCSNDHTQPCVVNADCPPGGTCVNLGPGIQDLCGDIANDPRNPILHDVKDVTVECIDANNDGFLDVAACTSWRQPGVNELCLSPLYAFPGAPSKCRCDEALDVEISVPRTIEACKATVPTNDPGLFDLQIAQTTERVDATNGDCTGPVAVESGVRAVGETAGTGTTLSAYTTNISCVDRVGRCTLDDTIHCTVNSVCNAANPGDTCDLTPSPVASCTNCTTILVTVDPIQASDILCTITNTNKCETAVCNPPIDPDCDNGQTCNPATGLCENDFVPASTPCTDSDGNTCTVAGCNGAGSCDQDHVLQPDSTPCPDTDGNLCTTAGCNHVGVCDQNHVVTTCPGGGGSQCSGAEFCNPASGLCEEQQFAPLSTPCEADGDLCTTDHCDGQGNCVPLSNVPCPSPTGPCDGGEQCDPGTGDCFTLPDTPLSTPCNEDGDLCTIDHCDGNGQCVLLSSVSCPGPTGPCDGGEECDQGSGNCVPLPDLPANTPCPDTDPDDCAMAGCDGQGNCNQNQILEPASTPCTDNDGNLCTTAGCDGAGTCDQNHIVLQCPVGICDTGTCDSQTGECIPQPLSTPCEVDGDPCTTDHCDGAGLCVFLETVSCPGPTGPCDGGEVCNDQTGLCEPQPDLPASTPCPDTDGNLCTTAGCNGAGTCDQTHIETPCPGECLTGVCDPGTGQCIPEQASTPCTDSDNNECTAAGCDGAGACDQTHILEPEGTPCETNGECDEFGDCQFPPPDDHYKCYKARQLGAKFARRDVALEDQFTTTLTTVLKPRRFCNPVDKNGEGIDDPTAHMMCYQIREPRFQRRDVVVENQFGQQTLTVLRPYDLCLPAEKDGVPSELNMNHFKCYKVMQRPPKFTEREVDLADQFETKATTVKKPRLLCNPVDKNGEGITDPKSHLTCYSIRDVAGEPRFLPREVEVMDQFVEQDLKTLRGDCRQISYLCVPSTKRIASPSGAFIEMRSGLLD